MLLEHPIFKISLGIASAAATFGLLAGCEKLRETRAEKLKESAYQHAANGDLDRALEISEIALRLDREDPVLRHFRGRVFWIRKQPEKAIDEYEAAYDLIGDALAPDEDSSFPGANPGTHIQIRLDYGNALEVLDRSAESRDVLEKALRLHPDDPQVLNGFAWLLATHPDDSLRDGKRAVELATKACELTDWERASIIDTLAAAHAEAGAFEEAVKWQSDANAQLKDDPDIADFEARLALYRERKPYRELPRDYYEKEMVERPSGPNED
ncbi:MAG: hypothetical protein KDM91_09635 [Verrucomicrobiae bacterium]|nr:hypothetical protein [Verrucomicrobiae bacterium]MCP5538956.1 hypothetical protein [Akkermansiaceae bacterium]MCP5550652.1 hypothetical protein [Akkermansiaceae bacterium]